MKKYLILIFSIHISVFCLSQNIAWPDSISQSSDYSKDFFKNPVWPESQISDYSNDLFKIRILEPDTIHRRVFSKTTRQDEPENISYSSEFFKDGKVYDVVFYPCEYIIYSKNLQITTQDETGLLYEAIKNIWYLQTANSLYKKSFRE